MGDARTDELTARCDRLADLAERRLALRTTSAVARERARQLRDHIDGFVRPRAADLDAPLLILLLGPTGAGKSSLLNTIAGAEVSAAGVLRPTTREAVLYATESDAQRITRGGRLARVASRIARAAKPARSDGVAIIDAPDIDSVERDNRELADVLVEIADLCVFVTTATRYADLVPWEVLQRVRDRGLPVVVVLNRLPRDRQDRDVVIADARRLLEEMGLSAQRGALDVVTVDEGDLDARVSGLARESVAPLLERIARLEFEGETRRAAAAAALEGAIGGLAPLARAVADDLESEATDAEALRRIAEEAYDDDLESLKRPLGGGMLLRAEVLRRWNEFVGADQVLRFFSTGLTRLRAMLISALRPGEPAPVATVEKEITSTLEALALRHASDAARRTATVWSERARAPDIARDPSLWSASAAFAPALREGLDAWMRSIVEEVRTRAGHKRAFAQVAALGVNVVGVAVMIGVFVHTAGITGTELGIAAGTAFLNQKLLEALFGERAMEELVSHARTRLDTLLGSLFTRERERFDALVAAPDELRGLAAELRDAVAGIDTKARAPA